MNAQNRIDFEQRLASARRDLARARAHEAMVRYEQRWLMVLTVMIAAGYFFLKVLP